MVQLPCFNGLEVQCLGAQGSSCIYVGFPKMEIGGTFVEVPIMGIRVLCGLYWCSSIYGNYHVVCMQDLVFKLFKFDFRLGNSASRKGYHELTCQNCRLLAVYPLAMSLNHYNDYKRSTASPEP